MSRVKVDPTDKVDLSTLDEKERERCRTDLLHLAREYLHYNDLDDTVHGDIFVYTNFIVAISVLALSFLKIRSDR